MEKEFKKIMVITSGEKGTGIACHLANTGSEVLLLTLDRHLLSGEKNPDKNNEILAGDKDPSPDARLLLESTINREPSPLYKKSFAERIRTGNFHDHINRIGTFDWLIEALDEDDENLDICRELFTIVEKHMEPRMLLSSAGSLASVSRIVANRTETFRKNFYGTHFPGSARFNRLLEIIPAEQTGHDMVNPLIQFGREILGKNTLVSNDSPGFIANRIGHFILMNTMESMRKHGLTVAETDQLTGRLIGNEKTATFRKLDMTGIDQLVRFGTTLFERLEEDEQRDLLKPADWMLEMNKRGWMGDKSGQGFYKKISMKNGKRKVLVLDTVALEYKPIKKTRFSTVKAAKSESKLKERIKILLKGTGPAGNFYRDYFYALFDYMTRRIPEITDDLYKIDEALRSGLGWEAGPFEIWDHIGVKSTIGEMEKAGYKPAGWVYDMLASGKDRFYQINNTQRHCFDISTGNYINIPGRKDILILDDLRKEKVLWSRQEASIIDLGEGILNVEFHSKMNTMGRDVVDAIRTGIELAEKDHRGLVIGNQGSNFTVGANLGILFMYAIEQAYDDIDELIKQFQDTIMRARYSKVPVVVATHGLSLGGGCELSLHADVVQAFSESYIGLVEVKAGLLPGGGGTKELTRRLVYNLNKDPDNYGQVKKIFRNILTAKVSSSAFEAFDMGILSSKDNISMNRDLLLANARSAAITLSEDGYKMPAKEEKIHIERSRLRSLLDEEIQSMSGEGLITTFEGKIAEKIVSIMCGGSTSNTGEVTEEYLLELEREAFLSLMTERKTLERMQAILQGKTPPKN